MINLKRKGSLFFDILFGIFIVGLVSIFLFPVLNSILNQSIRIKEKNEMNYIAESVVEKLYSLGPKSQVFKELESFNEVEFMDFYSDSKEKFRCTIIKENHNELLWELRILVYPKGEEGSKTNVEYKAIIPK